MNYPTPKTASKASALDCRLAVLGSDVRLTPHRREVFQVLAESTDHPTAYDVFHRVKERSPNISLATVYNCLEHLTSSGAIKQVHIERAQSRYCANIHEHAHFHCDSCGKVTDALPTTDFNPSLFWKLPAGVQVTHTNIAVRGLCPECAKRRTQS